MTLKWRRPMQQPNFRVAELQHQENSKNKQNRHQNGIIKQRNLFTKLGKIKYQNGN